MLTFSPLSVLRISVQPEGRVIDVSSPPSTVIPAMSTSPFATEAGFGITSVVAPDELLAELSADPKLVQLVAGGPHEALRATSCAAQEALDVAVATLFPVAP
jgi:hypothetical protein